jgi:glutathione S-transferase
MSLADWPVLQAYIARVGARPAVQEAMRAEGLVK